MLYALLKPLIRIFLKAYFRSFEVFGQENIPKSGPVIYVANHPSAALDPIVIAVSLKEKLFFLAAAEFFGKGLQKSIFEKEFNMIPVYRPWKSKKQKAQNQNMFEDCFKSLGKGNSILLFPEATSETVSKIRDLKTGAIRIKMGFESITQGNIKVPIIPIGLSYTNPHEFQSKVLLKMGKPVEFPQLPENLELADIYREKTKEIQKALEDCIIHIENSENESLVKKVNRLFANIYRNENDLSPKDKLSNFEFKQSVAKATAHFEVETPEEFKKIDNRISLYFEKLNQLKVSNDSIERSGRDELSVFKTLLLILGFPYYLIGICYFFFPYQLAKYIFRTQLKSKLESENQDDVVLGNQFTGTLIFGVGAVIYLVWGVVFFIVLGIYTNAWVYALIVSILSYPLLRFMLFYARIAFRAVVVIKSYFIATKHKKDWEFLVKERRELVEILKNYQEKYSAKKS